MNYPPRVKFKPFKAWLIWDSTDTYSPVMHMTRYEAEEYKRERSYLRDARFHIMRVKVSP